jgi:hypothetical protein
MQIESSQSNRRNYKLYRIPGFAGYGFSVNSNQRGNSHKITQIAPKSPAAQQGKMKYKKKQNLLLFLKSYF